MPAFTYNFERDRGQADPLERTMMNRPVTREVAREAEGQVAWAGPSPQVPGDRLVSFLV
jgi:hypothetical protein